MWHLCFPAAFSLGRKWDCGCGIWSMTGLKRKSSSTFSSVRKRVTLQITGGVWATLLLLFFPLLTQRWWNASNDFGLWGAKERFQKSGEAFLYLCHNFRNMPLNLCIMMLAIGADCVCGTSYSVYSNFPSKFPLQQESEDWRDFTNFTLVPELNKFTHVRNRIFHNRTVVA